MVFGIFTKYIFNTPYIFIFFSEFSSDGSREGVSINEIKGGRVYSQQLQSTIFTPSLDKAVKINKRGMYFLTKFVKFNLNKGEEVYNKLI